MVRKRPTPLEQGSQSSFTKTVFTPFFQKSPRLQDVPSDSSSRPPPSGGSSCTPIATIANSATSSRAKWLHDVWNATDAMVCMFEWRDILVRAIHVGRCLNAVTKSQGASQAVNEIRDMLLQGQPPGQAETERAGNDSNVGRFVNAKNEPINDDKWEQETASSIAALMRVLAGRKIALNVLGLFELLAKGGQEQANMKRRKLCLDLVEFELWRRFDVAVLKGMEVC